MPKQTNTETAKTEIKLSARDAARKAHGDAGFTGAKYRGISKTRNAAIAHTIDCNTSKATARTYAQLTERMHATLSELAAAYGKASFLVRGIDRGQAAIFLNSGFIVRDGETGDCTGNVYSDGKTPLRAKLSADTLKRYS